jgi:hypothetical protein
LAPELWGDWWLLIYRLTGCPSTWGYMTRRMELSNQAHWSLPGAFYMADYRVLHTCITWWKYGPRVSTWAGTNGHFGVSALDKKV